MQHIQLRRNRKCTSNIEHPLPLTKKDKNNKEERELHEYEKIQPHTKKKIYMANNSVSAV